jgi:hypothetical protein
MYVYSAEAHHDARVGPRVRVGVRRSCHGSRKIRLCVARHAVRAFIEVTDYVLDEATYQNVSYRVPAL